MGNSFGAALDDVKITVTGQAGGRAASREEASEEQAD